MAAEEIVNAASARWGHWLVYVKRNAGGWSAMVWDWPDGSPLSERKRLDSVTGLADVDAAIGWACALLDSRGAQVFIDGRNLPLSKFLAFVPVPSLVV